MRRDPTVEQFINYFEGLAAGLMLGAAGGAVSDSWVSRLVALAAAATFVGVLAFHGYYRWTRDNGGEIA
jgi:hypothetical protein